jgi:hypothetical protein
MTKSTLLGFSGTPVSSEELLALAEYAAPSHFISDDHLHEAAQNLAEWSDTAAVVVDALHLASARGDAPSVLQLLSETAQLLSGTAAVAA